MPRGRSTPCAKSFGRGFTRFWTRRPKLEKPARNSVPRPAKPSLRSFARWWWRWGWGSGCLIRSQRNCRSSWETDSPLRASRAIHASEHAEMVLVDRCCQGLARRDRGRSDPRPVDAMAMILKTNLARSSARYLAHPGRPPVTRTAFAALVTIGATGASSLSIDVHCWPMKWKRRRPFSGKRRRAGPGVHPGPGERLASGRDGDRAKNQGILTPHSPQPCIC